MSAAAAVRGAEAVAVVPVPHPLEAVVLSVVVWLVSGKPS